MTRTAVCAGMLGLLVMAWVVGWPANGFANDRT